MIIGCDFHPSFQQIACVEQETGEYEERRLNHRGEAEAFYRSLAGRAVRIGMEATGNDRWFHKLMSELGHELLVGDASAIHASAPREQRTDKRDARHILRLLVENRFPAIWQPSVGNEEQRQLLLHRCRLVRMRTRIKNQLDSIAKSEGLTGSRALKAKRPPADRGVAADGLVCRAAQRSTRATGRDGQANRASGRGREGGS